MVAFETGAEVSANIDNVVSKEADLDGDEDVFKMRERTPVS